MELINKNLLHHNVKSLSLIDITHNLLSPTKQIALRSMLDILAKTGKKSIAIRENPINQVLRNLRTSCNTANLPIPKIQRNTC